MKKEISSGTEKAEKLTLKNANEKPAAKKPVKSTAKKQTKKTAVKSRRQRRTNP